MATLDERIATVAGTPKKASNDSGSAEQHSLPDLIAADEHLAGKAAMAQSGLGIKRMRIKPPGTVFV